MWIALLLAGVPAWIKRTKEPQHSSLSTSWRLQVQHDQASHSCPQVFSSRWTVPTNGQIKPLLHQTTLPGVLSAMRKVTKMGKKFHWTKMSLLPVKSQREQYSAETTEILAHRKEHYWKRDHGKRGNQKQSMGGTIAKDEGEKGKLKTY